MAELRAAAVRHSPQGNGAPRGEAKRSLPIRLRWTGALSARAAPHGAEPLRARSAAPRCPRATGSRRNARTAHPVRGPRRQRAPTPTAAIVTSVRGRRPSGASGHGKATVRTPRASAGRRPRPRAPLPPSAGPPREGGARGAEAGRGETRLEPFPPPLARAARHRVPATWGRGCPCARAPCGLWRRAGQRSGRAATAGQPAGCGAPTRSPAGRRRSGGGGTGRCWLTSRRPPWAWWGCRTRPCRCTACTAR